MKKLVLALTALAAFTGSAMAADMAPRTYSKAPAPMAVAPSWTGFYIFGGVGGGVYDADNYWYNNTTGAPYVVNQKQGGDGWFGTVGAGYDWQFNSSWVAGVFADGQFGSLKGSIPGAFAGLAVTGSEKLRDTWAVGGRVGYLVAPNVLSYVNGGFTESYWSSSLLAPINGSSGPTASTPSFHKGGWFVGGGVENNLNIFGISAPGWFMKTEYRAAYFGTQHLVESSVATGLPTIVTTTYKPFVETISTSLVYRFNWTGPVVAKY
jgi:outer membrane immunogenic protein